MPNLPLIVGAGPVGLAAALFFQQNKVPYRLIEKLTERAPHSKALAVNPRTLELLEPTGVTEKMFAIGKRMIGGAFWGGGEAIAKANLADLPHKFPFMLALSQATSERLLEEALIEAGGTIERGVELISCRTLIGNVEATLSTGEVVQAPWLFAADGAHSTVRQRMGIEFKGDSFEKPWSLVDVPMDIDLPEDHANIVLLPSGGFLFVMRVVGDQTSNTSKPLWRVMGDVGDPIGRLSEMRKLSADAPIWQSDFKISHRLASTLQVDKICLGGDAGHIHSPAGARGMNLGIEDAWEFSQRVMRGMLAGYGASRTKIDGAVVRRVRRLTQVVLGESIATRTARSVLLPVGVDIGFVRRRAMRTITGIDHPLMLG